MSCSIAIIAALREELDAAAAGIPLAERFAVELIRGGVGLDSAQRAAQACQAAWICSTGFCGALNDQLEVGDIVIGAQLIDGAAKSERIAPIAVDAALVSAVAGALQSAGLRAHTGAIVSVRDPVFSGDAKRALGVSSGALAVDMESFALHQPGRNIFVLRTVSDAAGDELPAEVAGFLDEQGNVKAGAVTRFIFKRPTNIKTLWELKRRSDTAAKALTSAWKAAWPELQRHCKLKTSN
jgi:adenosylhomocysteine nucleosidase